MIIESLESYEKYIILLLDNNNTTAATPGSTGNGWIRRNFHPSELKSGHDNTNVPAQITMKTQIHGNGWGQQPMGAVRVLMTGTYHQQHK